jgi:class 3 adenylate cyclase/tetratricopeptide (TPR) repeat protein
MTCSVCGQPLPDGARFCPNCGAVVATTLATEERKVVTVLFADIVDSTGLAQRLDAERSREVLGRFFDTATEELQALRGRPEKFIGDAVMAVFGLPVVREDDAVRAVRAGLAIRAKTRRLGRTLGLTDPLDIRVGIESGEAATGIGPAGQLLVTGPVVNAAARLQAAAEPGEVLVGATTHALTDDGAVTFDARREVPAKGFDAALAAFPVTGLSTRSVRRTIPFVGRGSELMIMRECLTRVSASARPNLVTILGESGIGKSRLADEFVAGLDREVTVLSGQPRTSADTATFAPVAAIVGDLAGIEDGQPGDEIERRLRALAEERCSGPEAARTAGRLGLLFGLGDRGRDQSAFVGDVRSGFIELVNGLAQHGTVVVVFEDVHQLKAPMIDLIERLGAAGSRREPRRVLTLAVARQELIDERPTWASAAANAVVLRLDPLSPEEAVELVRQASGGRVDDAEAAVIADRAGGNPFFIVETTGMLLRDGDGEGERGAAPPVASLPPTVQAVVTARLDALPPNLRETTRRASVFLHSFDLDELAIVDQASKEELEQLEEAEILVRSDGEWRLRHATLREVAYASLPKRERARLHQLIADRLLVDGHVSFAADHLELAALAALDLDPDDRAAADRAVDALIDAAHRARRRMESRSAIDRYRRALALAGPEDRWGTREGRALAGLGESHYWLAEYPAATESLERAVQVGTAADDPWSLALALRFLGDIAINVEADVDKAEDLLNRSLAEAERLGDPWVIVRTLLFQGWVPWTRDRYDEAQAIWRRALDLAEEDDRWARVRAMVALSINLTNLDDYDGALRLADEAKALAEETGDRFSVAVSTVQKARVFEDLGRLEESLPCFDLGVATFEDLGARWELADAMAERGIVKRELGRLDEAEADLRHAVRISDELGERQLAGWTWKALARVAELRGDDEETEARRRRAREAEERRPR